MKELTPDFIKCAMEALEEGVSAQDIKEECACRMGLTLSAPQTPFKPSIKE